MLQPRVTYYLQQLLLNTVVFMVGYLSANYYGSVSTRHYTFYFFWDASIPFYPYWIYIYQSIWLLFISPVFVLQKEAIRKLSSTFLLSTLVACTIFIIFPAHPLFDRNIHDISTHPIYSWLYYFDLPYNLFPSLHVVYVLLFLLIYRHEKVKYLSYWYVWGLLLIISVLFTHQHQTMDIIGGAVLSGLVFKFRYLKM